MSTGQLPWGQSSFEDPCQRKGTIDLISSALCHPSYAKKICPSEILYTKDHCAARPWTSSEKTKEVLVQPHVKKIHMRNVQDSSISRLGRPDGGRV